LGWLSMGAEIQVFEGEEIPRSVSENFSLFCEICLKWNDVCATFRNHDQTIPHLPS